MREAARAPAPLRRSMGPVVMCPAVKQALNPMNNEARGSLGPAVLVPQPPHSRGAKAAWGLPSLSPSHPTAEGRRQTHDPIIPVDAAPWRGSQAAALRRSMGPAFLVPQPPHSRGAKAAWGLPSLSPSHPTAEGRRQTHDPIIPVDAAPWRGSQAAALRRSMGPAFLVPQPPHSRGAKADPRSHHPCRCCALERLPGSGPAEIHGACLPCPPATPQQRGEDRPTIPSSL
ncbi:hypothetical protein NDU88_004241 [Pleurodeles waltl]|uniref:Uncharacterized protein n=1 Tax=Pleurodeles waltl TaxID=8319 RepID=A0AAV7V4R0_PLEWA|nr:hypothetical protein NDU88_004241 [Pleurodeles waltl]